MTKPDPKYTPNKLSLLFKNITCIACPDLAKLCTKKIGLNPLSIKTSI
jgi:hypothetical protein